MTNTPDYLAKDFANPNRKDDTVDFQQPGTDPSSVHSRAFCLPRDFGRYRLLRLLGQGGMGTVFFAEDTRLGRNVAIKFPRVDKQDLEIEARFAREARAAASLSHRHICAVYDYGELNGQAYYVMPFVDGVTLAEFLKKHPYIHESQVVSILTKITSAIREAHMHSIIHRDLKPGNIMIDSHGEPIVLDFGLARPIGDSDTQLTATNVIVGTPAYLHFR